MKAFTAVPLSIRLIAGYYLIFGFWSLSGLFLRPLPPGWYAAMSSLLYIVVDFYLCYGLLHLEETARRLAIAYEILGAALFDFPYLNASKGIVFSNVSGRNLTELLPDAPFLFTSVLSVAIPRALKLWFLIRARRAFSESAD